LLPARTIRQGNVYVVNLVENDNHGPESLLSVVECIPEKTTDLELGTTDFGG